MWNSGREHKVVGENKEIGENRELYLREGTVEKNRECGTKGNC